MNRDEYIKHREELIKVIVEKCVTNNYPMVEKITINTGKEKNMSLWNIEPYNYIFYYTIGIKCSPYFFCEDKFKSIKDTIRFIQPYFLKQNEHIQRVDNLVDFKLNFPTF
jgi:hypothetical protein